MNIETDVLVVGGGIGGVVLAELLVRAGKRVLVVERGAGPPPFLRPEVLWPSAAQTLFKLRDRAAWEMDSFRPVGGVTIDRAGRLQPVITAAKLRAAGIEAFFENPNQTRETLLAECRAEVRRGTEVTEVIRDAGAVRGVQARELASGNSISISAGLTVGDDGAESRVRAACGIEISLEQFPVDFYVCGFPWPFAWEPDVAHVMFPPREDQSGLMAVAFIPVPPALAAPVAVVLGDPTPDPNALTNAWKAMLATAASAPPELHAVDFPAGFTKIGRRWGHASTYGAPGAVPDRRRAAPGQPGRRPGSKYGHQRRGRAGATHHRGRRKSGARLRGGGGGRPTLAGCGPPAWPRRFSVRSGFPGISSIAGLLLPRIVAIPGFVPAALRLLARGSSNTA